MVLLNEKEWESSSCSCKWWHKELKCNHITALACRLKLASFIQIAYSAPLTAKRKVGRPKESGNCLERQASAMQKETGVLMCYDGLDDSDNSIPLNVLQQAVVVTASVVPIPNKRGRKRKEVLSVTVSEPIIGASRYQKRDKKK